MKFIMLSFRHIIRPRHPSGEGFPVARRASSRRFPCAQGMVIGDCSTIIKRVIDSKRRTCRNNNKLHTQPFGTPLSSVG